MKKLLLLLLLVVSSISNAQTSVTGQITTNTTWTLANSPYIVTGNILVPTGVTLTIEPGVVVKVNNGLYIKTEGIINAIGTDTNQIIFESSEVTSDKSKWKGIIIRPTGGSIVDTNQNYISGSKFENVVLKNADVGLYIFNTGLYLNKSIFKYNNFGIEIRNTNGVLINNSTFIENNKGIMTEYEKYSPDDSTGNIVNTYINNNTFSNNQVGLDFMLNQRYFENLNVYNNLIKENNTGLSFSGGGYGCRVKSVYISKNIIINNTGDGLKVGQIYGYGGSNIVNSPPPNTYPLLLEKNTIINNPVFWDFGGGASGVPIKIANNIIFNPRPILDNYSQGIVFNGESTNNDLITNNLIVSNSNSLILKSLYTQYYPRNKTFTYNTFGGEPLGINSVASIYGSGHILNFNNFTNVKNNYILNNSFSDPINSENNYWGTTTESEIQSYIYDNSDNFERGVVSYSPFLVTPNTTAPISLPKNVIKSKVGNNIVLTWNSNPESDITGYKIYYGTPTGYSYSNVIDAGNVNTYTIVGGNLTTEYSVTAYDSSKTGVDDQVNGNESWYAVSEIVPELPTGIIADTAPRKIKLNWTLSSSDGVSSYKIYRGTTSNPTTEVGSVSGTTTSFIDTSVTNGVDYFYRIKSVKPSGLTSDFSANITAKSTNIWIVNKTGVTNGFGSNLDPILTIQSAITNASDGDEILVGDGVFNEGLLVNKEITLKSLNGYKKTTILRNSQFENIIKVFGIKNFKINGFSLVGSTQDWRNSLNSQNRGIKGELNNARISIQNCYFNNLEYAIHTGGGSFFDVNNSIFHNNRLFSFAEGGDNFTSDQQPKITHSLILDTQFAVTMGGANIVENFENTIIANSSALPREAPYFTTPVVLNKVLLGLKDTTPVGDNYKLIDDLESVYFKDYSNQDFSLKDSSPAIGYGNLILLNNKDLLGLTRPLPAGSNPDLGPIENLLSSPINASPKFNAINNVTINEDAVQQIISITGISDGDLFSTQGLSITATSSNALLIPNPTVVYNSGDTTGTIQFTPIANQSGTTTITVVLTDDGGTVGGGVNSVSKTFTVTVTPVNDAPVALGQTISTLQDTNKEIVLTASDIDSPVADLTYTITSLPVNGSLFQTSDGVNLGSRISVVPSVVTNSLGKIIYEPLWNVSGNGTGNFSFKANDGNLLSIAPEVIVINTTVANYPTLSLNTSLSTIAEHQSAIVTATLSTALNKDVNISLESLGTAINDIDFISQYSNKGIGEVKAGGNGVGSAMNQLNFPEKITVDSSGNLFIADYNNNRIQKWAPNSTSGETIISGVINPMDVKIGSNGDIYVLETGKVTKWSSTGTLIGVVSSGISTTPSGMYIDSNLNIFTTGFSDNSVYKSTALNPTAVKLIDNPGLNFIHWPEGIVSDSTGNLYISNRNGNIVKWNSANQQIITIISTNGVRDLVINSKGNLIVPKGGGSKQDYTFSISEYSLTGTLVKNLITSESNSSEFIGISGVALDKFENLYVSQSINPTKYGTDFTNLSKNRVLYYPLAPQIKIPAGQTTSQIIIQGIEDDFENEGNETIKLRTNVVPFTSINTPIDIDITLKDNTRKLTVVTNSPFVGVEKGSVSWGDFDNDGDQDVAVMGISGTGAITKVYENKNGVFVDTNQNFTRLYSGDISWVDINKDGWIDLVISGFNGTIPVTQIYINSKGTSFSNTVDFGLPQLYFSKMAWGDLDNDGDIDLAITGVDSNDKFGFYIYYRNDNQNSFTLESKSSNYPGVVNGDIKIVDIDLDGDNDILYNGENSNGAPESRIIYNTYIKNSITNPGNIITSLTLKNSVIEVAKIGTQNKLTILSSGVNSNGGVTLYTNELLDTSIGRASANLFPKLKNGDISLVDFNNDGTNDVLFTGEDSSGNPITRLYAQDLSGNFKLSPIVLEGLRNSTANWVDYDMDGDLDLFLTGVASQGGAKSLLYISEIANKPNSAPLIVTGLNAEDIGNGKIKFQWTAPKDDYGSNLGYVIRIGKTPGGTELTNTESNLSNGNRLITKQAPIYTNFYETILEPGKYYWSVQAVDPGLKGGEFSEEKSFTLTYDWKILNQGGIIDRTISGIANPIIKLADVNNDTLLDLLYINSDDKGSQLLQFDGKKLVSVEGNSNPNSLGNINKITSLDVGDIDRDGKMDILINNFDTSNKLSLITSNNTLLPVGDGLFKSKTRIVDINNDGKLDIVILGILSNLSGTPKLWIYEYDTTTTPPSFKKTDASSQIASLSNSSFDFGDIDKDQDIDLVVSGFSAVEGLKSIIYENTTVLGGAFTLKATDNNIVAIKDGTTDLIDYDGDGDLDIVQTGTSSNGDVFEIYTNKLSEGIKLWPRFASGLTPIRNSKLDIGDFNGDGYSDLLYSGITGSGTGQVTKLSEFDKVNLKYVDSNFDVSEFLTAEVEFVDLDGDDDLDFVIVGTNKNWDVNSTEEKYIFRTYINVRNDSAKILASNLTGKSSGGYTKSSTSSSISSYKLNAPPTIPVLPVNATKVISNATSVTGTYPVEFNWNPSTDDNTPSPGLTYSIKIGTTPGGEEIMSSSANTNGVRKVSTKGNAEHNIKWKVSLPAGQYYWSVQAIDAAYSGSEFTEPQKFTLSPSGVTILNGPFSIPNNNFLIETKSETCSGKNNGVIIIKATQTYDYKATINNKTYDFTNNNLTVGDLPPGVYSVCISVVGQTYSQCFSLKIEKGGSLTGKLSSSSFNKVAVEISQGTGPFEVLLNGISQFSTQNKNFVVDVKQGDLLEVSTSVACEGLFSKTIVEFPSAPIVYPNPTFGLIEVSIPEDRKEVYLELYSVNSVLISKGTYPVINQKIQLNLENESSGVYFIKLNLEKVFNLIVLKK